MEDSFIKDELLVVLVLYEKGLPESVAYKSLSAMGDFTFLIYDNSPQPHDVPPKANITYLHNPMNVGVSKAYNTGAELAVKKNKKWLLLADQDTCFEKDWSTALQSAVTSNPEMQIFTSKIFDQKGLLSPFILRWGRGIRLPNLLHEKFSFDKYHIINSGMVITVTLFKKAGGYSEIFPLDYSDIHFISKLKKLNCQCAVLSVMCHQQFNDLEATSAVKRKDRFIIFCRAVNNFKKETNSMVCRPWIIFPRLLKLAFGYRDLGFLRIGFRFLFAR
jgi:GT2 family glycosyltransferase